MATATLTNTPTQIVSCDSGETGGSWTGSAGDAFDSGLKKEGTDSRNVLLRGAGDTAYWTETTSLSITGQHIRAWVNNVAIAYMATEANGGLQFTIGDGTNTARWTIAGSDTYEGGWINVVIDYASTPDAGTKPTGNVSEFGTYWNQTTNPPNKLNTWIDNIAYGDGYTVTGGTTSDRLTLADIASADASAGHGIVNEYEGAYIFTGRLTVGSGGTATFLDLSNEIILFPDLNVNNIFEIEGTGNGCDLVFQNTSIKGNGTTNATRPILDFNNANFTLSLADSLFTNLNTTTFTGSAQSASGVTWNQCGQVTGNGATLTSCVFNESFAAVAVSVSNFNQVPSCDFTSDGTGHAVELTGTISTNTSMDWSATATGYAATSGSTGNETIKVNVSSGNTLTINVAAGATSPTYYNTGAGTVSVVAGQVTTTLTVRDINTKAVLQGAAVTVRASDGTGPLPYQDSVTITQTGGTATVSHTAHGLSTGQKVEIEGADQNNYNRIKTITVTGVNTYTFPVDSGTTSPATGTITSTGVLIDAETNASGQVSDTRSLSTDQNIDGYAAKGTRAPLYKRTPVSAQVDSANGLSLDILMQPD